MTRPIATIVQLQTKQEAKFICSACGADRGCNCNAPALEREAAERELHRQRQRRHAARKRKQKQQSADVSIDDEMPTEEQADEAWQQALYDQACLLLERMGDQTRRKLIAFIRRKFPDENEK